MKSEETITVIKSESELADISLLLQGMRRDLYRSRLLAWRLFVRNLNSTYRQTILGYLWILIPPVFTAFVFVFLRTRNIIEVNPTSIPYPVYVLSGVMFWQLFVDALNSPIKIVTQSASMLAKINFPKEALIIAGIGEVLVNFIPRLVLLVLVVVWFDVAIPITGLLLPICIMSLILIGVVLGLFLVPFAILFQDIEKGLPIITMIWFFLTPIIYPFPDEWKNSMLVYLNPVTPIIVTARESLTSGTVTFLPGFVIISLCSAGLLICAWVIYRISLPYLIERMSQ